MSRGAGDGGPPAAGDGAPWGRPALHVIADPRRWTPDRSAEIARAVVRGGADAVHLRGPGLGGRALLEWGRAVREGLAGTKGRLVVNDRVDVAMALHADGVQLPESGLAPREVRRLTSVALGVSRHGRGPWPSRVEADWILLGHVFETASHPGRRPLGVARLARSILEVEVPVLAIGGIRADRVEAVMRAGAAGVAVMGAIWGPRGIEGEIRRIREALRGWERRERARSEGSRCESW